MATNAQAAWDVLERYQSGGKLFIFEYSSVDKTIKWTFKKNNFSKKRNKGPYSLSDDNFVQTQDQLFRDLKEAKIPQATLDKVAIQLEEIRFAAEGTCYVAGLASRAPGNNSEISPLLSELENIEENLARSSEIYKSQHLMNIDLPKGVRLGIRAQLDRNGEFQNFTFHPIPANLKYVIEKSGNIHILKDPNGVALISFKIAKNDDQRIFLFSSKKSQTQSWVDSEHTSFELQRNPDNRSILMEISNDKVVSSGTKESVRLTTNEATHFPVKRISNNGDYIPLLDERSMGDKLSHLFKEDISAQFLKESSTYFERCMQYFVLQRSAGVISAHDESLKKYCEDISLWSVVDHHMDAIFKNEISLGSKAFDFKKNSDELRAQVKNCLSSEGLVEDGGSYFYVNPDKDHELKASQCATQFLTDLFRRKLIYELSNVQLAGGAKNEKLNQAFVQEVMSSAYEPCIKGKKVEQIRECVDSVQSKKNASIFVADITMSMLANSLLKDSQRIALSNNFQTCESKVTKEANSLEQRKNLKDCAISMVVELEKLTYRQSITTLISGLKNINTDLSGIKIDHESEFVACLEDEFKQTENFEDFRESQESRRAFCQLDIIKKLLPQIFIAKNRNTIGNILGDDADILKVEELLSQSLSLNIDKIKSFSDLDSFLEKQSPLLASVTIQTFFEKRCSRYSIDCEQNHELNQRLKLLIGKTDRRPFSYSLLSYFKEIEEKHGTRGVEVHALDLARSLNKEIVTTGMASGNEKQIYESCLEKFRPNIDVHFDQHLLKCDKELLANQIFLNGKKELENYVSLHFPLTTMSANNVLAPIQYYKECLLSIDVKNELSRESFEDRARSCTQLAKFEIYTNVSEAKAASMKSLFKNKDYDQLLVSNRNCYYRVLSDLQIKNELSLAKKDHPTLVDPERFPADIYMSLSQGMSGQLSMLALLEPSLNFNYNYKSGDRAVLLRLMDLMANDSEKNDSWLNEQLISCNKKHEDAIFASFREFIISKIPVVLSNRTNREAQEQIMRSFLDYELIDLFLKYTKSHAGGFDPMANSTLPGQRLVTSEMGLSSLSNFIGLMGDFVSKGFFFDQKQMTTELVVFQGELKDFFGWALSQESQPTVNEFMDFFKESKIADHLALAVVSENIHQQFDNFILEMKNDEIKKSPKSELSRIEAKYKNLSSLAQKMTASYDFRRILRPQGQKGEKFLTLIKQKILVPRIMGLQVSSKDELEVRKQLAEFILADNTDGGFTERFVSQMAQHYLDQDQKSHWALTKWLFYDSQDFNWNTLRDTKSGREAIKYYGKYILLPKILGQKNSKQVEDLRQNRFQKLLDKAQSENSH